MNKKIGCLVLCALLYPLFGWANGLPDQLAVPGGIIKIAVAKISQPAPKAFYGASRVAVTAGKDNWVALIGIPLSAQIGTHKITVKTADNNQNISFKVADKVYPAQHLTIKKKRMVTGFTKADLKKINTDKKAMTKAKSVWAEQSIDADFIAPVDGRLSSLFGLKRFFNDIPKRPHNGLDIAAKTGTAILAPASAKVIDIGNYYFNGNTVFLDHGQGLLSAYLHMNKIKVKPGQLVKQGDILGTVGATGRVTGPHLHWIVYLNKTPVDPALFIAKDIPRLDAKNSKKANNN
jgi:murein DD-endopeptidase MepM/ murein hydrolase activator NlpD